jgi:hypothetical protein
MKLRVTFPTVFVFAAYGVMLVAASACRPRAGDGAQPPWVGPTQPMADVVAEINANNAALPTLWARHYFEANIVEPGGKRKDFVNGDGTLVYAAPRGMRLVGKKVFEPLFEIGSSDDRYWMSMSVPNRTSTMWWGWYENLGKSCVDTSRLPIRPDLVLQVLGIGTINTNFLEPPVPVMRFNNDAHSYMFVWSYPAGSRWVAQKEIWYDRATKLPRRVFLFDADGRVVLRAKLSGHEPVELPEVAPEKWPKVARRYELFFPDTGSTMTFELSEVAPDSKGVLARRGVSFPENPSFDEIIQLDKDCVD